MGMMSYPRKDPSFLHKLEKTPSHDKYETKKGKYQAVITDCHIAGTAPEQGYRYCAGLWEMEWDARDQRYDMTSVDRKWFESKKNAKDWLDAAARRCFGAAGAV